MFDWGAFTLFLYIVMRMTGLIAFSPLFGRSGIPAMFQTGLILVLSLTVYYANGGTAPVPDNLFVFGLRLLGEMGVGFVIAMVMRFFFYIADQGGEIVDTQMGMSMARSYDPGSQSNMTTTSNILNILMMILFFAANGHITLLRLVMTSGDIVPFGTASILGTKLSLRVLEVFAECAILGIKLSLPILAAELLGQVGMGVLMKVIPQINVFAINIELKVIIGLVMLMLLISPIGEFLLETESAMLREFRNLLTLMNP